MDQHPPKLPTPIRTTNPIDPQYVHVPVMCKGTIGPAAVASLESAKVTLAERCLSRRPASETSSSWKPSVEEVDQSRASDGCIPHLMNDAAMGRSAIDQPSAINHQPSFSQPSAIKHHSTISHRSAISQRLIDFNQPTHPHREVHQR